MHLCHCLAALILLLIKVLRLPIFEHRLQDEFGRNIVHEILLNLLLEPHLMRASEEPWVLFLWAVHFDVKYVVLRFYLFRRADSHCVVELFFLVV